VAHQLEVTVRDIEQFKRQNELVSNAEPTEGAVATDYPGEVDLRAEDDALIAAELEAAEEEAEREEAEREKAEREKAEREKAEREEAEREEDRGEGDAEGEEDEAPVRTRRRGRRGGRRRAGARSGAGPLEGTFDHGEEGYGLWLDPAIQDNPIYAEHWAGHRPVEVTVEEDRIVIRRVGEDD
jgi:hypothetical protein